MRSHWSRISELQLTHMYELKPVWMHHVTQNARLQLTYRCEMKQQLLPKIHAIFYSICTYDDLSSEINSSTFGREVARNTLIVLIFSANILNILCSLYVRTVFYSLFPHNLIPNLYILITKLMTELTQQIFFLSISAFPTL